MTTRKKLYKFYWCGMPLIVTEDMYWLLAIANVNEVPVDEILLCYANL